METLVTTYSFAKKVKAKLLRDAMNPRTHLRILVTQSNMFDGIVSNVFEQARIVKASMNLNRQEIETELKRITQSPARVQARYGGVEAVSELQEEVATHLSEADHDDDLQEECEEVLSDSDSVSEYSSELDCESDPDSSDSENESLDINKYRHISSVSSYTLVPNSAMTVLDQADFSDESIVDYYSSSDSDSDVDAPSSPISNHYNIMHINQPAIYTCRDNYKSDNRPCLSVIFEECSEVDEDFFSVGDEKQTTDI